MKRLRFSSVASVALGSVLLLGVNAGTAFGASNATSTSSTRAAHLCRVIPRVVRLSVTRSAVGPTGSQFVFPFPRVVTVGRASAAQAVAKAACTLPVAPNKVRSCPAAFDVSYRLVFVASGEKGLDGEVIGLEPTGCEAVTGLGSIRNVTAHFYRLLGNAMGLKNATSQTFAGTFRSSS